MVLLGMVLLNPLAIVVVMLCSAFFYGAAFLKPC